MKLRDYSLASRQVRGFVTIAAGLAFVLSGSSAMAQHDLTKIVPPSPTAAALGEYGSVPIDMASGLPTISVPLLTVSGKDLSLSVDLSYHSGGIKVEEMSSWVGLGWSLNAGGVVTRAVRGLPDETGDGYMFSDFYIDSILTNESALLMLHQGLIDGEPDIFYYNFAGRSGSFVYNKSAQEFESIPASDIVIEYDVEHAGWSIITEDGTQYLFRNRETTLVTPCSGPTASGATVTGWYLTRMINHNKTDSIQFEYATPYVYQFTTLEGESKLIVAEVDEDCTNFDDEIHKNCLITNEITAQRLVSIHARGGHVDFLPSNSTRCDLPGDVSLMTIRNFNESEELLYSFNFHQSYFTSGSQCDGSSPHHFRLKLDSITRSSATGLQLLPYRSFDYSMVAMASRFSFGQDFWGYNNGVSSNANLIPDQIVLWQNPEPNPVLYPGANRKPSTEFSQMGMLTRMVYPTGGYTAFTYENHRVDSDYLRDVLQGSVHLDRFIGQTGPLYTETFTIDSPPSVLNGFNPSGGAFVDFLIDGITCDYGQQSGQASIGCAVISLSGPLGFTLTGNLNNRFLPNGSYTLSADFSTNTGPTNTWEDFYIRASWEVMDTVYSTNSLSGGLRIKKIVDYDLSKAARTRIYDYRLQSDTAVSSGKMDTLPSFRRVAVFRKVAPCPPPLGCYITYLCNRYIVTATSNYPVVGLGFPVAYSEVTVYEDEAGANGKSIYEFSSFPVIRDEVFPYSPPENFSWKSGKPIKERHYVRTATGYALVKSVTKTYKQVSTSITKGIKSGKLVVDVGPPQLTQEFQETIFEDYQNLNGHYYNDSTITKVFDPATGEVFETIQRSVLGGNHFSPIWSEQTGINGTNSVRSIYTKDLTLTSPTDNFSLAVSTQLSRNVNALLEQSTWHKQGTDSVMIAAVLTMPGIANGLVGDAKVLKAPAGSAFSVVSASGGTIAKDGDYELELEITGRDGLGNVTEGRGRDGIIHSYLWNDIGADVVASVVGSSRNKIFYTSFEDDTQNISTTAWTGAKSHSGTYSIDIGYTGQLHLSYWQKTGSASWEHIEADFTDQVTIGSPTALIDEVRVYPAGSQMTTYTYKPGVGITSTTDPNNRTTWFLYDDFGRLTSVTDHQANTITSNTYHYKGQN